jgi:peptidoglycan/xylan/chitin deacetylase (PgdA/CDA1 family)
MKRILSLLLALGLLGSLALPFSLASAEPTNLIANPSVETLSGSNPTNWTADKWGGNTTTMTVTGDAHTGNDGLNVTTTARTGGDAKWTHDAVNVVAGETYTYTDYSKATVATELDAAYTDASGAVNYVYLAAVQPSATWQQNTVNIKVPANKVKVQILHIMAAVGSLTTDDFSLTTQAQTPPPVVTPPATGENLIANPSMETANGSTPAGWQTGNWGTNATSFSYVTNDGHTGTSSVAVNTTSYTDGDAKWYFNPVAIQPSTQYTFSDYYKASAATSLVAQFDNGAGSYTYVPLANLAAASSWTQANATFTSPATAKNVTIFHLIAGVGSLQIDDVSLTAPASNPNPTTTVSITAPQNGATVTGSVVVTATPSVTTGVKNVQFKLDGANLGSPVTSAPYQYSWDTTTAANGAHSLTAVLTLTDGSTATSTAVQVTASNTTTPPATGGNIFPNASVETVTPGNTKLPLDWVHGSWGNNTVAFTYPSTGHTGTRSIKTQISSYSSGAAYWYMNPVAVTGGQTYSFTDYYKSNVMSEIDADIIMADGTEHDMYIGNAFPSPNSWTKFETQFTVPAGAVKITFFHAINAVGYVTTDDYSLTPFSYQGFNRALVTITDDDGWDSYYTNGLPVLQKYGLPSTAYIISSYINDPQYLTLAHLKGLYSAGVEIGSHSVDHPDLSTLGATKQDNELKNSQTALQNMIGAPVPNYAAPYGAYNQQIVTDAAKYYATYRGVEPGYNAKNNFDPMNLMVQNIVDTTTVADVQGWLAQAAATNTWLILVYHQIDSNPAAGEYNTYPADFDAQMAAVKNSGITVKTLQQAMQEITPQL